jgi:hypothetical protein
MESGDGQADRRGDTVRQPSCAMSTFARPRASSQPRSGDGSACRVPCAPGTDDPVPRSILVENGCTQNGYSASHRRERSTRPHTQNRYGASPDVTGPGPCCCRNFPARARRERPAWRFPPRSFQCGHSPAVRQRCPSRAARWRLFALTRIHRRSPVRVSAKPPASLPVVHPLELTGPQLMILDGYGQAPHSGIERRPLRDGPGAQHLADLDTQVEVERRRVMQVHDEPHDRHEPTVAPGCRHTCGRSPPKAAGPPVDDRIAARATSPESVPAARDRPLPAADSRSLSNEQGNHYMYAQAERENRRSGRRRQSASPSTQAYRTGRSAPSPGPIMKSKASRSHEHGVCGWPRSQRRTIQGTMPRAWRSVRTSPPAPRTSSSPCRATQKRMPRLSAQTRPMRLRGFMTSITGELRQSSEAFDISGLIDEVIDPGGDFGHSNYRILFQHHRHQMHPARPRLWP